MKANKTKEKEVKGKLKSVSSASKELGEYLKKHKLDPNKDWTDDPVHGKKIRKLMQEVRVASKKKLHDTHVKQDEAKDLKKKAKEASEKSLNKPVEKVKAVKSQPTSYDYPMVNGKPMSPEMKKKYRGKMRRLLKANLSPDQAQKKTMEFLGMDVSATAQPVKTEKKKKKEKKDLDKKRVKRHEED